ncbi:23S rRNA (adenine(1618)-N(6))-methyltransferase RlmF [Vibrio ostreae]|uniref:Ribosomal RNA large subunit methyltransferase F n=1 Tax=Vibrio ostreae TaxID=2841925 RepID=A0A975YPN2_9VIBR|nr:23S rRNA (adenine(1618)-N(6))-methyltransferase RlmF [Vibrio ostreae]
MPKPPLKSSGNHPARVTDKPRCYKNRQDKAEQPKAEHQRKSDVKPGRKPSGKTDPQTASQRTPGQKPGKSPSAKPQSAKQTGKAGLHVRNRHKGNYDFDALCQALPDLKRHLIKNPKGDWTIAFSDPLAVKLLNKALLAHHYGVMNWDIPEGYLCPPIPGRADYIHRVADLLSQDFPALNHKAIRALDIGIGANCIYPIIGVTEYGWSYVGSDVDPVSVKQANLIASNNPLLKGKIAARLQKNSKAMFSGIIGADERFDVTTCNPPFHASLAEAQQGTERKIRNLRDNQRKRGAPVVQMTAPQHSANTLNFGGQKAELWCPGGEAEFIKNMAQESQHFARQVLWFTTLISKSDNVRWMKKQLQKVGAASIQIVEMQQGQKISRFVAWTFHNAEQRKLWLSLKR